MIFIVARTAQCANSIALREGLQREQATWLTSTMMHKIVSADEPKVWIADCGLEMLTPDDKDLLIARRSHLTRVTC